MVTWWMIVKVTVAEVMEGGVLSGSWRGMW